MIIKQLIILLLLFFSLCQISCRNNVFFDSAITFEQGWHKDSVAVFNVSVEDTSKIMNFVLTFKHSENYGFCNLWIFASVENLELNTVQKDTIELYMSYPDGRWFGRKNGKYRYISTYYKHNAKMANPGNYIFKFQQGMRVDNIEEIKGVELTISD